MEDRDWHKSTFSGSGNCVEVRMRSEAVEVRHTQDRTGPALQFTPAEWVAFVQGVRAGEFDVPGVPRRRGFWSFKR